MVGDFVKTASSRFQVQHQTEQGGKKGGRDACLQRTYKKFLVTIMIYTKNLSMYILAIDHCHSALTNYMEWVEEDDNIVRNWKVVW